MSLHNYPYQDPELSIRKRVEDLLSRMSLVEKVGQVNQHLYGWECYKKEGSTISFTDKFKEHVAWGKGVGALYGLFRADPWSKVDYSKGVPAKDSWKVTNAIQKYIIEQSRWGIPALIVEECPHGHQGLDGVSYPVNIGRGSTFNPKLVRQSSELMAKELASKGVHIALVSTLDLLKDPRWGRSEECFGEDATVSGKMTEAIIAGFQKDLIHDDKHFLDQSVIEIDKDKHQIGVVLKHCIAQGEALGGHNSGTVPIGIREFSDIYTPLLKSARNAVGVMAAYNDIDGVPCHANRVLLKDQLRGQIGFQGLVMADGVALDRLQDVYETQEEAASAALSAGVDLSLWDQTYTKIASGVEANVIVEQDLDEAVRRVLAIKFLLGLFEHPFVDDPAEQLQETLSQSEKVNIEVANESLVMVKNNGVLPLHPQGKKIAVIGPNANDIYHLLGDYSAPQSKKQVDKTIFKELQAYFSEANVYFSEGCEVRNLENQEQKIQEAIVLGRSSDIIITVLGGSSARIFDMEFLSNGAVSSKGINMDSGENVDVASLKLGGQQEKLLTELAKLEKPMITILVQGRPYEISLVEKLSDAVMLAWFPGQEGGRAIAQTLGGENNPSGRLSISYPLNSSQLPVYYYQRAASKQDEYFDQSGRPLHEFGYGLSYTQFSYKDLYAKTGVDNIEVSVKVKNEGKVAGKISSLLFVKLYGGSVIQRTKLLKDFRKDFLEPEEEVEIHFCLPPDSFRFIDADNCRHLAKKATIMVEDLSLDIQLNW